MKKLTVFLLSTYLGLAPVYWWPGVDPQILDALKLALVGTAVILVWLQAIMNRSFVLPRGATGPMGLVLLLAVSSMAFAQSTFTMSLLQLKDYLLAFLMLWTFALYVGLGQEPRHVLTVAALILGAHCLLVASSRFLGVPRWSGPSQFVAPELWVSGFGALRTGWSCGIAPFVPIALSVALQGRHGLFKRVVFAGMAAAVVLSQLTVAGRGGVVASLVGMAWIITGPGLRRWLPLFAGAGLAALYLARDFLFEAMRLERLSGGAINSVHDLNKFSAHRVDSDIAAFNVFLDSPLLGHGFHEFTFGEGSEVHNLWLRLAVEGGILLPFGLAWVVWHIWSAASRHTVKRGEPEAPLPDGRFLQAIILMGVVMSMLEPRMLLGSFQTNAVWWATAGIAVGHWIEQRKRKTSGQRKPVSRVAPLGGKAFSLGGGTSGCAQRIAAAPTGRRECGGLRSNLQRFIYVWTESG